MKTFIEDLHYIPEQEEQPIVDDASLLYQHEDLHYIPPEQAN